MLDNKLQQYRDRFEENFPIFYFRNKTEEQIIQLIDHCIQIGKPYEVEDDDDQETVI